MTSLILVILSAGVLFGNRNKIVKVLDKMVPFMAALYLIVVFYIIVKNIGLMGTTMVDIFEHAFGVKQFLGGTFGSVVMEGVKRGLFSNEAGSGSAPCAAAAAEVEHPAKQGLIQALGVLVDTVVICSATAFVILLSKGHVQEGLGGMTLLQEAFRYHVGEWGVVFTAVILFLFSFSTILGIPCFSAFRQAAGWRLRCRRPALPPVRTPPSSRSPRWYRSGTRLPIPPWHTPPTGLIFPMNLWLRFQTT